VCRQYRARSRPAQPGGTFVPQSLTRRSSWCQRPAEHACADGVLADHSGERLIVSDPTVNVVAVTEVRETLGSCQKLTADWPPVMP
jgi:hypothetical protein